MVALAVGVVLLLEVGLDEVALVVLRVYGGCALPLGLHGN